MIIEIYCKFYQSIEFRSLSSDSESILVLHSKSPSTRVSSRKLRRRRLTEMILRTFQNRELCQISCLLSFQLCVSHLSLHLIRKVARYGWSTSLKWKLCIICCQQLFCSWCFIETPFTAFSTVAFDFNWIVSETVGFKLFEVLVRFSRSL